MPIANQRPDRACCNERDFTAGVTPAWREAEGRRRWWRGAGGAASGAGSSASSARSATSSARAVISARPSTTASRCSPWTRRLTVVAASSRKTFDATGVAHRIGAREDGEGPRQLCRIGEPHSTCSRTRAASWPRPDTRAARSSRVGPAPLQAPARPPPTSRRRDPGRRFEPTAGHGSRCRSQAWVLVILGGPGFAKPGRCTASARSARARRDLPRSSPGSVAPRSSTSAVPK